MEPVLVVCGLALALAGIPLAMAGVSLVLRTTGDAVALHGRARFRVWAWLASMTVLVPIVRSMPAAHAQPPALSWTEGRASVPASDPESVPLGDMYVVEPGDSLWAIAARHLEARDRPRGDAEVNRFWQRIYEANREVVGCDPDLIHPGQRLSIPEV